jgi:methylamine dehydrogenase heavy chain
LGAIAEVPIPPKTTVLWFRNYISLLDDERHVAIFNMTPAQSISIVDVIDREFVGEISTPGCALILPMPNRSFVMICGDGSLQLIRLDEKGHEVKRSRSNKFFVVEKDPVFDQVARTDDGWLLVSHAGLVFHVTTDGDSIKLSKPWSMLAAEDGAEEWRPGGFQPMGFHRGSRALYVLMHQGGIDTHYEEGEEVWVFDVDRQKRIGRLKLESTANAIQTTQEKTPKFLTISSEGNVEVYDGQLLRHLRTIKHPVGSPWYLQTLGRND